MGVILDLDSDAKQIEHKRKKYERKMKYISKKIDEGIFPFYVNSSNDYNFDVYIVVDLKKRGYNAQKLNDGRIEVNKSFIDKTNIVHTFPC